MLVVVRVHELRQVRGERGEECRGLHFALTRFGLVHGIAHAALHFAVPVGLEKAEPFKCVNLILDATVAVVVVLVHLQFAEPEHVVRGPAMARHAFRTTRVVPHLLALALRGLHCELLVEPVRFDECGVGAGVVPEVRVAVPLAALLRHESRLDPLAGRGVAFGRFECEALHEHGLVWEAPGAAREGDPLARRHRHEPFLVQTVRPERRVHRIRHDAWLHLVVLHGVEEPAGGDRAGEVALLRRGVRLEGVEAALAGFVVIADQQFALGIRGERGDLQWRDGDLLVPEHFLAVVFDGPDVAGAVVAVEVGTLQFRVTFAVIDDAAGERAGFGVMVLDGGLHDRRRPDLAFQIERMTTFHDAPAVIVPLADEHGGFPQILAVLPHPDVAGLRVGTHAPRVAEPVRPRLRYEALVVHKRVVLWNGVHHPRAHALRLAGMIDIDSQHLRQHQVGALPGKVGVRIRGAVAAGDEERAIEAEGDGAAVVPVRFPGQNRGRALRVERERRLRLHRVAGDEAHLPRIPPAAPAAPPDVHEAVLGELRMEGEVRGRAAGRSREHGHSLGRLRLRDHLEFRSAIGLRLRDDQQSVAAGNVLRLNGEVGSIRGDRSHDFVRRRRIGEADHRRTRDPLALLAALHARPHERERRIVLGLMEERTLRLRDRRDAGEFRFLPVLVVVVAAEVEAPLFAGLGPTAGAEEIGPRDAALHRPTLVHVVALVQGAAEFHLRVDVEVAELLLLVEVRDLALGHEAIELRAGGVHLKFEVPRLRAIRMKEEFEDVVVPGVAVVFCHVREEVRVLHLGEEVEVLAVPEQLGFGAGAGHARFLAEPGEMERIDDLSILPCRFVGRAIERNGQFGESALEGSRRSLLQRRRNRMIHGKAHTQREGGEHCEPERANQGTRCHGWLAGLRRQEDMIPREDRSHVAFERKKLGGFTPSSVSFSAGDRT